MKLNRIGIDIGATSIKSGLVSAEGELLARQQVAVCRNFTNSEFSQAVLESIKPLLKHEIEGIGIGSFGPLNKEAGIILESANMPEIKQCALVSFLKQATNNPSYPILLNNDANCAAMGQFIYGEAKGSESSLTITLGTGVGGGAIIKNKIFEGHQGNALEVGHISVFNQWAIQNNMPMIQCGCGNIGCLEAYCSATGISKHFEVLTSQSKSAAEISKIAAYTKEARFVYRTLGELLGEAIVSLVHLFNFEVVVITGGISAARNLFEKYLLDVVDKKTFKVLHDRLKIKITKGEAHSGILGAAALLN